MKKVNYVLVSLALCLVAGMFASCKALNTLGEALTGSIEKVSIVYSDSIKDLGLVLTIDEMNDDCTEVVSNVLPTTDVLHLTKTKDFDVKDKMKSAKFYRLTLTENSGKEIVFNKGDAEYKGANYNIICGYGNSNYEIVYMGANSKGSVINFKINKVAITK